MKKPLLFCAVIFLLITASSSFPLFSKPKTKAPEIIDYSGKKAGEAIPEWIEDFVLGNTDELKMDLGLESTDKVWCVMDKSDSVDDSLLKCKIKAYADVMNMIYTDANSYYSSEEPDYSKKETSRTFSFCGIDSRSETTWVGDTQTMYMEDSYYVTPFGTMFGHYEYGKAIEEQSSEMIIPMSVHSDGKIVCPSQYEDLFEWFRNKQNVRIDQFWIKKKEADSSA